MAELTGNRNTATQAYKSSWIGTPEKGNKHILMSQIISENKQQQKKKIAL